jgi:hypothetical protein
MSPHNSPAVDDVISVIRYLGQQHAALELTKTYKGVIVQENVSILDVNPDGAAFRTSNIQMSAALEGDVYLHNQIFPRPVMAQLKSLNLSKGMLVLSDFSYSNSEWRKRQYERVQPKHPVYVTLYWRGKAFRVFMKNISVNGMGILAFKILGSGKKIQPGSHVRLDFQLSPEHKYTALKGKVIYIKPINRSSANLGIQLFPTAKESRLLDNYIEPRKQEILEELNQAYWESMRPGGVESLYF